jgi:hypothetical protein
MEAQKPHHKSETLKGDYAPDLRSLETMLVNMAFSSNNAPPLVVWVAYPQIHP